MELSCLALRSLVFWYCLFTIAIDLDGTWGRSQYYIRFSVKFQLFVEDIERYVILINPLPCYTVGLAIAIGALSTSTPELIFSAPVFTV